VQRVVPLAADPQFARMLREAADIRLAVSVPALAAPASVAGLFGDRVLNVFLIAERLFAALDLVIHPDDGLIGQALRAVAIDYGLLPAALVRKDGTAAISPSVRLAEGDRVVGLISLSDLERLLRREPVARTLSVVVTACPLPTVPWLAGLLRTTRGLNQEDADKAAAVLPLTVAEGLTRGQAEDLLTQLGRERVTAHAV
jgi:hypothetical protein